MADAQGPAALARGVTQQLSEPEDRWRHAFSFASPVPSSSLAALQRPAQEGTSGGGTASGRGGGGVEAVPARSRSTSPAALALVATLETAAKQRVRHCS